MPKLSVIVPVYKVEKYLHKCVDSIICQTLKDFECFLIDDGSTDNCGDICDEYAVNDNRLIVIHQKNKGVSSARNKGLELVNGEYVGFVDSDDWIESNMYETMYNVTSNNKYEIVICGINYYNETYEFSRSDLFGNQEYDKETLLKSLYGKPNPNGGSLWNKIFLFDAVNKIRCKDEISMAEDWIYLFDAIKNCNRAIRIDYQLYNVCERKDSATRKDEAKAYYDIIFGGKLLLLLGRSYSLELEKIATDKYIDDCIRYSNIIKEIGLKNSNSWRLWFIRIRLKALLIMPRVIMKKLLPANKIHGYLYELIKL